MPSNRKGGSWCSVYGCRNNSNMNKNISFFRYPKNIERSKAWIHATGRRDLLKKGTEYAYKNCRVCAKHFEDEMFANDLKNRLLPTAVPKILVSNDATNDEQSKTQTQKDDKITNFQRPNDFFDNYRPMEHEMECQEPKTYHELQTVILNLKYDHEQIELEKVESSSTNSEMNLDENSIQNKRIYAKCDVCNKKMLSTNFSKHQLMHKIS
ncbi:uncharacterized protein LOC123301036 [Chrysoperla carnea]|uniref:uncharacterized protein LOC123301036 n=1 Tax=Chrysoperla carnea TaxID=189513 RepID=UPI001D062331|nr:uncharacterized protein LOC123301036 [Chrysoperla carnea]